MVDLFAFQVVMQENLKAHFCCYGAQRVNMKVKLRKLKYCVEVLWISWRTELVMATKGHQTLQISNHSHYS